MNFIAAVQALVDEGVPAPIRAKRAAGRAKDLQVLPELESLQEAGEPE